MHALYILACSFMHDLFLWGPCAWLKVAYQKNQWPFEPFRIRSCLLEFAFIRLLQKVKNENRRLRVSQTCTPWLKNFRKKKKSQEITLTVVFECKKIGFSKQLYTECCNPPSKNGTVFQIMKCEWMIHGGKSITYLIKFSKIEIRLCNEVTCFPAMPLDYMHLAHRERRNFMRDMYKTPEWTGSFSLCQSWKLHLKWRIISHKSYLEIFA